MRRACTLVAAVLHLVLSARAIAKLCLLVPRLLHAHTHVTPQELATRYTCYTCYSCPEPRVGGSRLHTRVVRVTLAARI